MADPKTLQSTTIKELKSSIKITTKKKKSYCYSYKRFLLKAVVARNHKDKGIQLARRRSRTHRGLEHSRFLLLFFLLTVI